MDDKKCREQVHFFCIGGLVFLAIGLGLLLASLFMPLGVNSSPVGQERRIGDISLFTLDKDRLSLLEQRATERLLIKAAQAQAAVKDSGLAAELAKNLRLQGIANMPEGLTAYIRNMKEKRTLTVREGDKAAEFIVRRVEENSVTLDLEGVEVKLSY